MHHILPAYYAKSKRQLAQFHASEWLKVTWVYMSTSWKLQQVRREWQSKFGSVAIWHTGGLLVGCTAVCTVYHRKICLWSWLEGFFPMLSYFPRLLRGCGYPDQVLYACPEVLANCSVPESIGHCWSCAPLSSPCGSGDLLHENRSISGVFGGMRGWGKAHPLVCVCEGVARDVDGFGLVMGGPSSSSQMLHDTAVLQGEGLRAVILRTASVGFACFLPKRSIWSGGSSERGQWPDWRHVQEHVSEKARVPVL